MATLPRVLKKLSNAVAELREEMDNMQKMIENVTKMMAAMLNIAKQRP